MVASVEIGGAAYLYVNGSMQTLKGNLKIAFGGITREPVVGPDGSVNFTTKYLASTMEAECFDLPSLSVGTFKGLQDTQIQMELNNGKTYQLYSAFQYDDIEVNVIEGSFSVKFAGTLQEIL